MRFLKSAPSYLLMIITLGVTRGRRLGMLSFLHIRTISKHEG